MKELLVKTIGFIINALSWISKTDAVRKALWLFETPRKGQITKKHSTFLDTACKQTLKYDDLSIMTYRWAGKKQTILLAHGWESNAARWKRLIEILIQHDYDIVAIDAPAHGNSGSERFNAIIYSEFINITTKHFQPNILIGHSVGGMASALSQYKHRIKNVEKLILLGAPSELTDILQRYFNMLGYNQRIINQIKLAIIARFGKAPEEFSTAKFSEKILSKGLIIHDINDNIVPYNDALLIHKSFKKSKLITTTGFGHSLNNHQVIDYIKKFIDN